MVISSGTRLEQGYGKEILVIVEDAKTTISGGRNKFAATCSSQVLANCVANAVLESSREAAVSDSVILVED